MKKRFIVSLFILTLVIGSVASLAQEKVNLAEIRVDQNSIRFSSMKENNVKLDARKDINLATNPNIFSDKVKNVWMWFSMKDSQNQNIEGIKVSKIELVQGGKVIARSNDIESRSISGNYRASNLEFINSFENKNGENLIDIVFYLGRNQVAKVDDYSIHAYQSPKVIDSYPNSIGINSNKYNINFDLINVDKTATIATYIVDENGQTIASLDKIMEDYYEESSKKRQVEVGLSLEEGMELDTNQSYEFLVTVGGKEVENLSWGKELYVAETPQIDIIEDAIIEDLRYEIVGLNLINNGPYSLVIEQDGIRTGSIENIRAKINEDSYEEEINIELGQELFNNYGEMYVATLYDENGNSMLSHRFLEPIDDTSDIKDDIDEVDPFQGYKIFDKVDKVETNKVWKIKFNKPIDPSEVDKSNIYVIDKATKKSIDIDYQLESDNRVVAIEALNTGFKSKNSYYLIVEDRVKSSSGGALSQPAILEFNVR